MLASRANHIDECPIDGWGVLLLRRLESPVPEPAAAVPSRNPGEARSGAPSRTCCLRRLSCLLWKRRHQARSGFATILGNGKGNPARRQRGPEARREPDVLARAERDGSSPDRCHRGRRRDGPPGARIRRDEAARLHRQPEAGPRSVPHDQAKGPPSGRRGCLAVLPAHPPRADDPPRPNPDRSQLERPVARTRGHAEPERKPHQGRRGLFDALERGLHRRVLLHGVASLGARPEDQAPAAPRASGGRPDPSAQVDAPRPCRGRRPAPAQGDSRRLRRRLHGHVQRHHSR